MSPSSFQDGQIPPEHAGCQLLSANLQHADKTCPNNDLILDNNIDYFFLSETWLITNASAVLPEASPPNFNFVLH